MQGCPAVIDGVDVYITCSGYTGEDGFEIYIKPQDAISVWESVMKAGEDFGVSPCGLGSRDSLRFEACLPLYGHELSPEITPLQASLGFFVKLWKRIRKVDGSMAFCNVSAHEQEVLRVTRLDTLWPVCTSREQAVEQLRQTGGSSPSD